jgi:hypothetical protein
MALASNTVHDSDNVLSLLSEDTNITSTGVVGGDTSESVITVSVTDVNMALLSNTVQDSGNVVSLPSDVTNITSTGVLGSDISESVITVTTIDENIAMLSSNRAEISGNVLSLSSETTNITPTGVAGGDISESVISVTTNENIAYASSIRAEYNVDGISLSLEAEDIISTSVIGEVISESTIVAVPSIDNNKLVGKDIRVIPSDVNFMTLSNTRYVTGNIQDFYVSGESVRDLDRNRYDAESFDVSTFSDNIVAASLVYRDSMFITELQTPILQPSSVWQHPRGDIHFKTGITEPYSLGMYFIYF